MKVVTQKQVERSHASNYTYKTPTPITPSVQCLRLNISITVQEAHGYMQLTSNIPISVNNINQFMPKDLENIKWGNKICASICGYTESTS